MWSVFIVVSVCAQSGRDAVVLDRNQLAAWIPKYLTATRFDLAFRQITSISPGTFTGLSQLQELDLTFNQLTSLDASIFEGLSQLRILWLYQNQLTSLDPYIFNGLSQLEELRLNNNQLTSTE
jgi:Leucine-rich repeat (LRR) protein